MESARTTPPTRISRLGEKQSESRERLHELLDSTPLATVALVRDGHPVAFPTGFARIANELVIHGSTGSRWLGALGDGASAAVSVTVLDGVVVARSGFESSFRYRSAVVFGTFQRVTDGEQLHYLKILTDTFIPGRVAELRASTRKELAATMTLRMPIESDNWSLKISGGWPDDPDEDVVAGAWAGVVPLITAYGEPLTAPDVPVDTPLPASVRAMTGTLRNIAPPGPTGVDAPATFPTNLANVRMSAKAEYAVRAMVHLASVDEGGLVKTDELAKAQGIPPQFLVDILSDLRTDRLVRSHRGRDGGYELARPATDISIADVLRCIDGPLASVRDIGFGDLPYSGPTAALTDVWRALRASMRSVLEETSVADVASGALPEHVAKMADDYIGQEAQRGHSVG